MDHAAVASATPLAPFPLKPLARTIPGRRPLDLMRAIWSPANPLDLDKHERALLAALVVKMDNPSGDCGALHLATLEDATGLSRATVERAAAGLIGRRLVARLTRHRPDGGHAPSHYWIRLEAFGIAPAPIADRDGPRLPERPSSLPPDPPALSTCEGSGPAPEARTQGERKGVEPGAETLPPDAEAILDALRAGPLAPVASPFFARRLAKEEVSRARPLPLALKGLGELAAAAGDDAAEGRPWPVERLRRSCRTWIRGARDDAARKPWGASGMKVDRSPVQAPAPSSVHAAGGAAVLAAIDLHIRGPRPLG